MICVYVYVIVLTFNVFVCPKLLEVQGAVSLLHTVRNPLLEVPVKFRTKEWQEARHMKGLVKRIISGRLKRTCRCLEAGNVCQVRKEGWMNGKVARQGWSKYLTLKKW